MSRYNPPPYSPHYDFVALRPMTIQGVEVGRGETINKAHFSEQRLRQMFDARMIAPAGFGDAPAPVYLNNGKGKADEIARQIAAEEAALSKSESHAQSRPVAKPAPAQRANAKKAAAAAPPSTAKKVVKPAAKKLPAKRAGARAR